MCHVTDVNASGHRKVNYGRKEEEYAADFILVTRRSLTSDEYRIFNYRYLLGADWRLCTRKLKTDRGSFFHTVYRIEEKLGRIFRELQPYALHPIDEYFYGAQRNDAAPHAKVVTMAPRRSLSQDVPIRKAA